MPKLPIPRRPVVCFDESPTQLIGEVRQPIPAAPGEPQRFDYEYRRNGTANLFVYLDAHRPWRIVKARNYGLVGLEVRLHHAASSRLAMRAFCQASISLSSQPTERSLNWRAWGNSALC